MKMVECAPLLLAAITLLAPSPALGKGQNKGSCTFSPDCAACQEMIADATCVCNRGKCEVVGLHPSDWADPDAKKECDKGGYKDCACKYTLSLHYYIITLLHYNIVTL